MPEFTCNGCLRTVNEEPALVMTNADTLSSYCHACATSEFVKPCVACGRVTAAPVIHTAEVPLCLSCVSEGYGFCRNCGSLCNPVNPSGLCAVCAEDNHEVLIVPPNAAETQLNHYHYRPRTLLFRTARGDDGYYDPFMGFELEVDRSDSPPAHLQARRVVPQVAEHNYAWCTSDGSIHYGFEMISHPMTLEAHKHASWPKRLTRILASGFRSYDRTNCGMHVHVSRNFLREEVWLELDDWISGHKDFVIDVARRHSTSYARFHQDMSDSDVQYVRRGCSRYAAVNFSNARTIEFRIFRGTLVARSLLKNLEFIDAVVRFFKFGDSTHSIEAFATFVDKQPKRYAEFIDFIKERNIKYR